MGTARRAVLLTPSDPMTNPIPEPPETDDARREQQIRDRAYSLASTKMTTLPDADFDWLLSQLSSLRERNEALREALRQIAKAEGPYSLDPFTHAENTIEAMALVAEAALSSSREPRNGNV